MRHFGARPRAGPATAGKGRDEEAGVLPTGKIRAASVVLHYPSPHPPLGLCSPPVRPLLPHSLLLAPHAGVEAPTAAVCADRAGKRAFEGSGGGGGGGSHSAGSRCPPNRAGHLAVG